MLRRGLEDSAPATQHNSPNQIVKRHEIRPTAHWQPTLNSDEFSYQSDSTRNHPLFSCIKPSYNLDNSFARLSRAG